MQTNHQINQRLARTALRTRRAARREEQQLRIKFAARYTRLLSYMNPVFPHYPRGVQRNDTVFVHGYKGDIYTD